MLQSGLHKQHMKDLFVELCLTVPVRLSSLLPYLPMLMDPLVSALNGSQTLVSQGLRTLELCVDNLQPDFLYDHIQPVRAELMQVNVLFPVKPQEVVDSLNIRILCETLVIKTWKNCCENHACLICVQNTIWCYAAKLKILKILKAN